MITSIEEQWLPVKGFEGRYEVSSLGRVRGLPREMVYSDGRRGRLSGRVLYGALGLSGYLTVSLDTKTKRAVHRLVAEAFLPAVDRPATVNHINGDKQDNRAVNLEWASYARNNRHARETGLNPPTHKYDDQLIAALRRVHARYQPTIAELGELFGISSQYAGEIVRGVHRARGVVP